MEWYNILFYVSTLLFIVSIIVTLNKIDNIDFDVGDINNYIFNPITNSILGFFTCFSGYLCIITKSSHLYIEPENSYPFTIWNYIIAICIGLIAFFILFGLQIIIKESVINKINDRQCTVLINNGLINNDNQKMYSYTVLINSELNTRQINILSKKPNLKPGDEYTLHKNKQGIYFI